MLGAGVEVVVVGREPGFGQPTGLLVGEHAGGHAGLQPQLPDPAHHAEHGLKWGPIADLAPGPTHAKAMGSGGFCGPGPLQHGRHLQLWMGAHIAAVMHRLGAVGAVLLTATGLDAEQRGQLHLVAGIGLAMHLLGLPEQIHQGELKKLLDLVTAPVVA